MTTSDYNNSSLPEYWEQSYQSGDMGWDLGVPTPVFNEWISSNKKSLSICVLGAGNGWDALNFARKGHTVTAVDFAISAIKNMRQSAKEWNVNLNLVYSDIFNLEKMFCSDFDIVIEYTCYCAINPLKRTEYVNLVNHILNSKGKLVALFFPIDKELNKDGPPYGIDLDATLASFSQYFNVERQEKPRLSIKQRKGREIFVILNKHGN